MNETGNLKPTSFQWLRSLVFEQIRLIVLLSVNKCLFSSLFAQHPLQLKAKMFLYGLAIHLSHYGVWMGVGD